jgi:thiamine-phosphate pyrophosphorylase
MRAPRVLLITDAAFDDRVVLSVIERAGRALPAGDLAVQLRDKGRPDRAAWARTIREATRVVGVPFVVNWSSESDGGVALARAVGADGVHFGRGATEAAVASAAGLFRSSAAHSDDDVVRARAAGLDAVLVSPIFASPGKGEPRGVGALAAARAIGGSSLAVLALGGVSSAESRACRAAGADGVAVIRALLGAEDPAAAAVGLARA